MISIDCKKKENIGNFKNNGAEYSPKGNPTEVLDHDFSLPELGKAAPYWIYDIALNEGFVNVGISSDTAQFAVNSIRSWWNEMCKERYPEAKEILITADGGGSNGSRNPLISLQVIIDLIASTTTSTGLKVVAKSDEKQYATRIKVYDVDFKSMSICGDEFHPDWNYKISPRLQRLIVHNSFSTIKTELCITT